MFTRFLAATALAGLAACATPNPPTVTTSDVNAAMSEAQFISTLPVTASQNLPSGSASYSGQMGADISGDASGSLLGDMLLQVDFADNDVDGTISNINLIDPDGIPDQRFDGTLDIDGIENAGEIDAFAAGELTGVDTDGYEVSSQTLLILEGDIRDDLTTGDAVYGTASGSAQGDFDLDIDGVFFGTRR